MWRLQHPFWITLFSFLWEFVVRMRPIFCLFRSVYCSSCHTSHDSTYWSIPSNHLVTGPKSHSRSLRALKYMRSAVPDVILHCLIASFSLPPCQLRILSFRWEHWLGLDPAGFNPVLQWLSLLQEISGDLLRSPWWFETQLIPNSFRQSTTSLLAESNLRPGFC